uniref:hypothetical protein n=1 Tax=Proteus mirabilis TaxID=584 RepID=UPI001B38B6DF
TFAKAISISALASNNSGALFNELFNIYFKEFACELNNTPPKITNVIILSLFIENTDITSNKKI